MTRFDAMFLRELEELEKDKDGDGWSVLQTARSLRKLLFDQGQPFVHLINRTEKLNLQFEVGGGYFRGLAATVGKEIGLPDEVMSTTLWDIADGLLPEKMSPERRHVLTLPEFLKYIIVQVGAWEYSIKDIIEFCAYHHGVVHPKEPAASDQKNRALLAWSDRAAFQPHGLPGEIYLLRHICTITLRGLGPLRAAVQQRHRTRPGGP